MICRGAHRVSNKLLQSLLPGDIVIEIGSNFHAAQNVVSSGRLWWAAFPTLLIVCSDVYKRTLTFIKRAPNFCDEPRGQDLCVITDLWNHIFSSWSPMYVVVYELQRES